MLQPKTGAKCSCKRGVQRDNCPTCEGTGWVVDFAAILAATRPLDAYEKWMVQSNLARVKAGEMTTDEAVATLEANGYGRVARELGKAVRS